jgi:hypothetical protein
VRARERGWNRACRKAVVPADGRVIQPPLGSAQNAGLKAHRTSHFFLREHSSAGAAQALPTYNHVVEFPTFMVTAFTRILANPDGRRLRPDSLLPAPKETLKTAIVEEARRAKREGAQVYVQRLKTAYGMLGRFVTNDVAVRDAVPATRRSDDLIEAQREEQRLIDEFEALLSGRAPRPLAS